MKQEVMNYEADIIRKDTSMESNPQRHDPAYLRYTEWGLDHTLELILSRHDYSLKWIGNDPNANILAFFYCALCGSLKDESGGDNLFIKLKYNLYQQAKETLPLNQQKNFVEHIRLAEHSKNIGEFLKKSRYLESMLIKIFHFKKADLLRKHIKDSAVPQSKMQELQFYSVSFPFFHFEVINDKCGKFTMKDQISYIVEEKGCFFVVQDKGYSALSSNFSAFSILTKKVKGDTYSQKTFPRFSRPHNDQSNRGDPEKQLLQNASPPPSFLGRVKQNYFKGPDSKEKLRKLSIKYQQATKLTSIDEIEGKKNLLSPGNKMRSLQKVKQSKSFRTLNNQNEYFGSMRTSLGQDTMHSFQNLQKHAVKQKTHRTGNLSSSIDKISKQHARSSHKMWKTVKDSKHSEQKPEERPKQRSNFIYQSLGSNDSKEKLKIPPAAPLNTAQKKTPQFLCRKNLQKSDFQRQKTEEFTSRGYLNLSPQQRSQKKVEVKMTSRNPNKEQPPSSERRAHIEEKPDGFHIENVSFKQSRKISEHRNLMSN